jgi:hypothetical protein
MMPLKKGFFVFCRELGRELGKYRVGTAMMTDVGGDRRHDKLYLMIPLPDDQANQLESVLLVMNSSEKQIVIEIDRISQEKIDNAG